MVLKIIKDKNLNKLLILLVLMTSVGCVTTTDKKSESTEPSTNDPATTATTTAVKDLEQSVKELKQTLATTSNQLEACKDELVEQDKVVIGEVEYVGLVREKVGFDARIDTGATTSSLGVFNIVEFERDGKKWVKFTLEKEKTSKVYEYPILRITPITNPSKKTVTRRPVIEMMMSMGKKNYKAEFNLADRSHMTFKILIGREFLTDRVIVDVSHEHLMKGE